MTTRTEHRGFDVGKMLQHVVTIMVTTIVLSAGKIVWDGATTWKDEVRITSQNFSALVTNLSQRLSVYENNLSTLTNQLAQIKTSFDRSIEEIYSQIGEDNAEMIMGHIREMSATVAVPTQQAPQEIPEEDLESWHRASQMLQQQAIQEDLTKSFKK